MPWRKLEGPGPLSKIDWGASLDGRADPYLFWAEQTGFRTYRSAADNLRRAAFELKSASDGPALLKAVSGETTLTIAPRYETLLRAGLTRFFVGRVDITALTTAPWATRVQRFKLALVADDEMVVSPAKVQTEDPIAEAERLAAASRPLPPELLKWLIDQQTKDPVTFRQKFELMSGRLKQHLRGNSIAFELLNRSDFGLSDSAVGALPSGRASERWSGTEESSRPQATDPPAKPPLMGIIDFGCPFAHRRFSRSGKVWRTRIAHFWDMGIKPEVQPSAWAPCASFGYGREATAGGLDALIAQVVAAQGYSGTPGNEAVERLCYLKAGLPELAESSRAWAHGTVVMDFAAGADPDDGIAAAEPAAQADVIFVQMPRDAVADLSGGWLSVYVLDALNYIIDKAAGRPVVVNVSFGSFAGSHDGTSLLERAMDDIAQAGDATVVLAAGNTRQLRVHAQAVLAKGEKRSVYWHLTPQDATQSFLELWYAAGDGKPADVEIHVEHDDAKGMQPLRGAGARDFAWPGQPQEPIASVLSVPGAIHGRADGLVLLSLAPTDPDVRLPDWPTSRAPSGHWTVSVTNHGVSPVTAHAWVERDDPDLSPESQEAQTSLQQFPGGPSFDIADSATLTGQTCGEHTVVVGSRAQRAPSPSLLAPSSAWGPARSGSRRGPDLVAPGIAWESSGQFTGLLAAANVSGQTVEVSGTSIAAPRVARQIFNMIARTPGPAVRAAVVNALLGSARGPGREPIPSDSECGNGYIDDSGACKRW